MSLGILYFMPTESLLKEIKENSTRQAHENQANVARFINGMEEDWPKPRSESASTWPRISTAIRREEFFVLEASTPLFTAHLTFNPEVHDSGVYKISYPSNRTMPVDEGKTVHIKRHTKPTEMASLSMLKPYAYRFVIRTLPSSRPIQEMLWRVGFNEFKSVEDITESI